MVEDPGPRAARSSAYEAARPEIAALVPPDARRVLDLGCAAGALGATLKARSEVEVVGVEADAAYAQAASEVLDRVLVGDLEQLADDASAAEELGGFDCIVAADVLEHLRDPWSALRRFAGLLDAGGTAIVSLPNVRYWETFWQLARHGTWPRRVDGIFDRDHLRWFTVRDGLELVQSADLEPVHVERLYRLGPSRPSWPAPARLLERRPFAPFLTFQFLIVARHG